jgi:hypothetical protein
MYRAARLASALAKARAEAERYIEGNPEFQLVFQPTVYVLHKKDELFEGAEVWSTLLEGASDSEKFVADRYKKFELNSKG